jgi:hypothetical protein
MKGNTDMANKAMTQDAMTDEAVTDDDDGIMFVGYADEDLHALGDQIHEQVSALDQEEPRYSWALDPDDGSVLLCLDNETEEYVSVQIAEETQWAADLLGEVMQVVAKITTP